MTLPKFLLGDNTDHPEDIFIVHTEYPQFIINLLNDDIEWLDELRGDESEIAIGNNAGLIEEASIFYDREMERYVKNSTIYFFAFLTNSNWATSVLAVNMTIINSRYIFF